LRNRKQCGSTCKCKNCGNGKLSNVPNAESGVHKRKRNYEPIFKRKKGCDYLAQQGFDINSGSWTSIYWNNCFQYNNFKHLCKKLFHITTLLTAASFIVT
jgi:hypothetical protein